MTFHSQIPGLFFPNMSLLLILINSLQFENGRLTPNFSFRSNNKETALQGTTYTLKFSATNS